jgi:hypothetical protein
MLCSRIGSIFRQDIPVVISDVKTKPFAAATVGNVTLAYFHQAVESEMEYSHGKYPECAAKPYPKLYK